MDNKAPVYGTGDSRFVPGRINFSFFTSEDMGRRGTTVITSELRSVLRQSRRQHCCTGSVYRAGRAPRLTRRIRLDRRLVLAARQLARFHGTDAVLRAYAPALLRGPLVHGGSRIASSAEVSIREDTFRCRLPSPRCPYPSTDTFEASNDVDTVWIPTWMLMWMLTWRPPAYYESPPRGRTSAPSAATRRTCTTAPACFRATEMRSRRFHSADACFASLAHHAVDRHPRFRSDQGPHRTAVSQRVSGSPRPEAMVSVSLPTLLSVARRRTAPDWLSSPPAAAG